jgi:beta-glucosidase
MACILFLFGCKDAPDRNDHLSDKDRIKLEASASPEIEKKIHDLLSKMTLEEKVGQMVQIIPAHNDEPQAIILGKRNVGSLYFYTFAPNLSMAEWYNLIKEFQETFLKHNRLKIPPLIPRCHQHGAVDIKNSTVFPHNISLAATFNPLFGWDMGKVTVLECADI